MIETAKALEAAMKERVQVHTAGDVQKEESIMEGMSKKPIDQWPAGSLLGAFRRLDVAKVNIFKDFLGGELTGIRNLIHEKGEAYSFGPRDADKCNIYLSLLVRSWYGSN